MIMEPPASFLSIHLLSRTRTAAQCSSPRDGPPALPSPACAEGEPGRAWSERARRVRMGPTLEWRRFEELTAGELYELLRFRQRIFVVEQRCPYPDLDGLDQNAWHLLAHAEGVLAGCIRLIPRPLRIGRVAIAARLRRRGLGRSLM